jgi:Golgi phosphoprotein 3 GPP34
MADTAGLTDLLLVEELLLLVLDDEKGHNTAYGAEMGLAGALLLDLASAGLLQVTDGKLMAAPRPANDPEPAGILADALAAIRAEPKPRDPKHWVRKLPSALKPIRTRVAQRLVEAGILSQQRRKVLGLVGVERFVEADPEPERALHERLRAELTGERDVSVRTALLVPLLRAHALIPKLVPKDQRAAAEKRAKQIAEDAPALGGAVRSVLSDDMIAIYVGTGVTVAGGFDGGGDGG